MFLKSAYSTSPKTSMVENQKIAGTSFVIFQVMSFSFDACKNNFHCTKLNIFSHTNNVFYISTFRFQFSYNP